MPYVTPEERKGPDQVISCAAQVAVDQPKGTYTDGQMNYLISRLVAKQYSLSCPRYSNIQRAVGLLVCVVFELYRRVAGKYEDKKMGENGDVREYAD